MSTPTNAPLVLHYVFDPLCGWCYAAEPLVRAARGVAGIAVQWHAGGMLTGPHTRTMTAEWREKVMPSNARITAMTGQPFGDAHTNGLLKQEGLLLDSEPPTTALLAAQALGGKAWEMLEAEQRAYYVDGRHISDPSVLREIATGLGLDGAAYDAAYTAHSGRATQEHIENSRQWLNLLQGQGFPTFGLEFDHPEHPGQRAVQRIEIGEWLGDVEGWAQQLAAWAEQVAAFAQQGSAAAGAGHTDPTCGPDGCELPQR